MYSFLANQTRIFSFILWEVLAHFQNNVRLVRSESCTQTFCSQAVVPTFQLQFSGRIWVRAEFGQSLESLPAANSK